MTADNDLQHPGDDPLIGVQLGNFKVVERIATGGMGVIYRAVHTVIGRQAAIKVLSRKYSRDQNMVKRLHREARAVNRIGHPNIVDIFDFGRTPDGREYFVMEYLPGESLAEFFDRQRRQPWSFSRQVLADVLAALGAAHEHGIVHRDIKPENILVVPGEDGQITAKVLDFGIAKSVGVGPLGEQLTRAGSVMGTPEHIAPEQVRGKQIDGRADLYAVGTILFELIAGRRPYESEDVIALLMMHLRDPVPDVGELPPELGIPPQATTAVRKAMAKDPEDRFSDARAFAQALGLPIHSVSAADGTRPLPAAFWQMDSSQSTGHAQHTAPSGDLDGHAPGPRTGAAERTSSDAITVRTDPGYRDEMELAAPRPLRKMGWMVAGAAAIALGLAAVAAVALRGRDEVVSGRSATDGPANARDESTPARDFEPVKDMDRFIFKVRETLREGLRDPNPQIRRASVRGIADLDEPDAPTLVMKRLRADPDPGVRAAAALALADIGDKSLHQALLGERKESDPVVRVWIDEALLRLGSQVGRTGLLGALRSANDQIRFSAALALAESGDARAATQLKQLLQRAGTQRMAAALYALARLDHAEARETLKSGLTKADHTVQLYFAEALAKLGDPKALDVLAKLLTHADLPTRLMAAKVLAMLGDDVGFDLLRKSARAKESRIRLLAFVGMGAVADRAALPPLNAGLSDPDPVTRTAAAESAAMVLSLMPEQLLRRSQNWVLATLDNRDWSMRYAAVGVTSEMDPELAVELLGWAFRDKDERVRAAAIARLATLPHKSPKALEIIKAGLGDRSPDVRRTATVALRAVAGQDARPLLSRLIHDKTPTVGIAAAGQLLALGDDRFVAQLSQAAKARDPRVRAAALDALGNWPRDPAPSLLAAGLKDSAAAVRLTAALQLARRGDQTGAEVLLEAVKRGDDRSGEAWDALVKMKALDRARIESMARASSAQSRKLAMGSANQVLSPAQARQLLARGAQDEDPVVRRAAAQALAQRARKDASAVARLRLLRRDADPVVRATAAVGLANVAKTATPSSAAKPVRPAPTPKQPKLPVGPATKATKHTGRLWIEDSGKHRAYKLSISRAAVLESRGQYRSALRELRRAKAALKRPAVDLEIGKIHLKIALKNGARSPTGKRHLKLAERHFKACLSHSPRGTLGAKARAGIADVSRLTGRSRRGR